MRAPARRTTRGATLLELLAALAVAALLLRLSVPVYATWIARLEQHGAAEALVNALQRARSEAIRRSERVTVCRSVDGRSCAGPGTWQVGWLTFDDLANAGQPAPGEPPIAPAAPLAGTISIVGNRPVADYVSYTPYGHPRSLSGALQIGTFTVCRSGLQALQVVLASSGRLRLVQTVTPCP